MSVVQVWLLFGVPALLLGLALFVGRSAWRSGLGYVVLLAGFGTVAAFDRASGAVFGGLLALLYAAGLPRDRGTEADAAEGVGGRDPNVPGMMAEDRTLKPGQHA